MNKADLSYFCCLVCGSDLFLKVFEPEETGEKNVIEGILCCHECKIFYPIVKGVPFLLDYGYYSYFDIKGFFKKWNSKFNFNNYKLLNRKTVSEKLKQLNFYNTDSETYDDLVSYSNFWKASDWNVLHGWFNELSNDATILDVGCGTGRCTIPLALSGRRVIGTDLSIGMIRKAVKKSAECGVGNITYFLADAEDLPLRANLFSAVISFGMLHHVADPLAVIKGVKKFLRPCGRFYALENHASPMRFIFDSLMKIRKLWNEEAGSHPLFRIKEVEDYIRCNGMLPDIQTSTFLPPHLFNRINYKLAKKILYLTDCFFGRIPLINNFGGQLIIKATKNDGKK